MDGWDPSAYLRFSDERTRPAVDLASRIALESPESVIDLGCGAGNSTAILKRRWPTARVVGLDSSPAMIEAASHSHPDDDWVVADIASWRPESRFGFVFSNAALRSRSKGLGHHGCRRRLPHSRWSDPASTATDWHL